ncbi:MAG: aldo/keto reductase [Rhizomicrobium sp.]
MPRSRADHVRLGRHLFPPANPRKSWAPRSRGRRDKVLISTKATFRAGEGANDLGSSRFHLTRAVEGSLKRLGTDHIDLFQLHGYDAKTPPEEVLSTLDTLIRAGKIGYIGVSNFSGWHLMKALAVADKYGLPRYVANQTYYSLIGRDYEWELLPLGLDQGPGRGGVVAARLGPSHRQDPPRPALPETSRLHKTAEMGPAGARRASLQGGRRAGRGGEGGRQDRAAGRASTGCCSARPCRPW